MPLISDVWSHEFNGIEHISLIHAKFGNNHLQKEIAEANNDGKTKGQTTLKTSDEVSVHVPQPVYMFVFSAHKTNIHFQLSTPGKLPFVLISKLAPPPKFS